MMLFVNDDVLLVRSHDTSPALEGYPLAKTKTTQNGRSKTAAKAKGTSGTARTTKRTASKSTAKRKPATARDAEVTVDRREKSDRRKTTDRRKQSTPVKVERRKIERRAKVNRRRQIDPTTCERDYTVDEVEFMNALDEYKRTNGRMFPTCSEILEVIKKLGYVKCPKQAAAETASEPHAEPTAEVAAAAV